MALLLLETPSHFMDHHLNCRRHPGNVFTAVKHRPSCKRHSHNNQVQKTVSFDLAASDKFEVQLDVKDFTPDEITATIVGRQIVVEAKSEKKNEQVFESKHLVRKYTLPEGYNTEDVTTSLSTGGLLTIVACRPKVEEKPKERHVPIKFVNNNCVKK
ncbi:heat shock protein 27-like [Arctopsyche grandis]|uniref:heat shock protein 27-like n=1 Tax=Arctopsyche grandis TaxID=121162 RepID=UPI00406D7E8D